MRIKNKGKNYTATSLVFASDGYSLPDNRGFTAVDASGAVAIESRDGTSSTIYCEQGVFYPISVNKIKLTGSTPKQFDLLDDGTADAYDSLIADAQIVGDDLAVTTTRTGSRQSIVEGGSDVGPNETDIVTSGGIPFISSMNGAENLIDTDISEWAKFRFSTPDANSIREDETVNTRVVRETFAGTSNCTFTLEIKPVGRELVQLEFNGGTYKAKFILSGSGSVGFVSGAGTSAEIEQGSDGYYICTMTTVSASIDQVDIRGLDDDGNASYQGNTSKGYEVKNVRVVDSTVKHPAFLDGTAASEVYGTDLNVCSPTWGNEGTIVQIKTTYGYSGGDNPVTGNNRFYATGNGFNFYASGLHRFTGSAGTPGYNLNCSSVDSVPDIISHDWNEVVTGGRCDDTARVELTEADIPTGDLYIGNNQSATSVFHGLMATIIFPWVLSDTGYEIVRQGLTNLANSIIFK